MIQKSVCAAIFACAAVLLTGCDHSPSYDVASLFKNKTCSHSDYVKYRIAADDNQIKADGYEKANDKTYGAYKTVLAEKESTEEVKACEQGPEVVVADCDQLASPQFGAHRAAPVQGEDLKLPDGMAACEVASERAANGSSDPILSTEYARLLYASYATYRSNEDKEDAQTAKETSSSDALHVAKVESALHHASALGQVHAKTLLCQYVVEFRRPDPNGEALADCTEAWSKGDKYAAWALATIYDEGTLAPRNISAAISYYQAADGQEGLSTKSRIAELQAELAQQNNTSGENSGSGNNDAAIVSWLDGVVATDAQSWLVNHYDSGSMTGLEITDSSADGKSYIAKAYYTFNGGTRGWVKARVEDDHLSCVEFWDFAGDCRQARGPAPARSYGGGDYAGNYDSNSNSNFDPSVGRQQQQEPEPEPEPEPVQPISPFYGEPNWGGATPQ